MVPFQSTADEVSFEWSHHRISSTDSKVSTTLHASIIDSGSAIRSLKCLAAILPTKIAHALLACPTLCLNENGKKKAWTSPELSCCSDDVLDTELIQGTTGYGSLKYTHGKTVKMLVYVFDIVVIFRCMNAGNQRKQVQAFSLSFSSPRESLN